MFCKIVLVSFLAAVVLAQQDPQQLENEKVQQTQPIWQQYRPVIGFTRDTEGIQKVVRLPNNPFFQEIRVNVKPYPGGYVAIKTNGAEIIKPFTATPDATQDQEIIIEPETPDELKQQQILQQQQLLQDEQQGLYGDYQQYKRSVPFYYPQQYLNRYPIWSRFLQPQQLTYGDYYRPYGQLEDIYGQQGEYDRVVRDTTTTTKKDKKSKGDKLQESQEKLDQEQQGLYNPYSRVPLFYQPYQRVPYQIYGKQGIYDQSFYQQQQQVPLYQQQVPLYQQQVPYYRQPYSSPVLNRLLGYQQQFPLYQQQQYQPYNLPVYNI